MIATGTTSELSRQPWEAQRRGRLSWGLDAPGSAASGPRLAFDEDEDEPDDLDIDEDEYDDDDDADDAFDDDDFDDDEDDDEDLDEEDEDDDL